MILASQSPRRIELMREAGYEFRVIPARVDETPYVDEDPFALVGRLSQTKAHAVAAAHAEPGEVVVAADTIVTLDGEILGKPADIDDARRMLRELSGRTHQVATGVCLLRTAGTDGGDAATAAGEDGCAPRESVRAPCEDAFTAVTDVEFYELTKDEIEAYVATGEPFDKAGAYGIQGGAGRMLVRGIRGDFYNVVGLPVAEVVRHLKRL